MGEGSWGVIKVVLEIYQSATTFSFNKNVGRFVVVRETYSYFVRRLIFSRPVCTQFAAHVTRHSTVRVTDLGYDGSRAVRVFHSVSF